ncbi:MAG: GlsB/YeaQ/YmgE family stress response membrane protein [Pyrinomonadaceae bacterium]|nr:GlsB/YeaQ/YmgE family stress response membrane protein [Pyrinomonadaceae bacterium]
MIFNIISWIIFGLIVGAIAKFLIPGVDGGSWINTILLGIAGSFIGGFLGNFLFGGKSENHARYGGWIMSIVGAIILQLIIRYFFR